MFDLAEHTVFLALSGSHAYQTHVADSDLDVRGVCVAPKEVRCSLFASFEQFDGLIPPTLGNGVGERFEDRPEIAHSIETQKLEGVVYEMAKFLRLCAKANPTALEVLFSDQRDWIVSTPLWEIVHEAREIFLTKQVEASFVGYAQGQLKRIQTHAFKPPNPLRNPKRAALEAKHGFDTKHGMHLIRLLRMGLEVLRGDGLNVRREDAEELKAIRNGIWTYDQLLENAAALQAQIQMASQTCELPERADRAKVDALYLRVLEVSDGGIDRENTGG